MGEKFYSNGSTVAQIGDTVLYCSADGDTHISRIVAFLPPGDGADIKLADGDVAIVGNCKKLANSQEVC